MRRVLCLIFALILAVSLVIVPAFASDFSDGSSTGGGRYEVKDYTWGDVVVKYAISPVFDILNGVWNEANAFAENVTDTIREEVQANVLDGIEFWKDVVDALSYDDYVSTLDSTTAGSSVALTGFSSGSLLYLDSYCPRNALYQFAGNYPSELLKLLKSLGIADKVAILCIGKPSPHTLVGLYWDDTGRLTQAFFENPSGSLDSSLLGVYSLADLVLSSSQGVYMMAGGTYVGWLYYDKSYAEAVSTFATAGCGAVDWSGGISWDSSKGMLIPAFYKTYQDSSWYDGTTTLHTRQADALILNTYGPSMTSLVWDNSRIIVQPTNTTSTSRPVSFANSITNYNTYNFYGDDATVVNYYIGSTDDSGELTGIFNFVIFDEDTMIFTDPETGSEYQATGWSYDYTIRTYDIAFDAGTMTVNDTDITQVLLTYGDEAVTIQYYDTSGNLIDTRSYVYLQVAQTGCAINGHSYTYETIKEATCTHAGERKYTCSVCGDEYAEDIPMSEHTSTFSIFKESTCTESGIGLYSCSTCGTEYTETIDALGHDWLEQETIDTTYALPEGTSCPDCAGTEFSSELDEIAGVYVCICSGCGAEWEVDAVINYGETHYTCSVCGATRTESLDPDNGLFTAIGDLLADAVTWVTGKLSQLVDSLSGLNDSFQEYMEQIKGSGGEYPAFLAAFVAVLPEDLMTVLWFALIAVLVLAVWEKWFS